MDSMSGILTPLTVDSFPSRIECRSSASVREACHLGSVRSGMEGMARRTILPLPSVSWQAMQTRRYICSGGIPAGAVVATGAVVAAGVVATAVAPGPGPAAGAAGVAVGPGTAAGGAGGRLLSAKYNSMARSMGMRSLLLVTGSTQP